MKRYIPNLFILIILMIVPVLNAQDLAVYEVADNASLGLGITPYSKYGMAIGDINKDGYPEIYCLRWNGDGQHSRFYLNLGGTFQEISDQTPLPQIEGQGNNLSRTAVFADFDNDGDQDLSFGNPDDIFLLRNDNGTFVDVSTEMGFKGGKPPGFIVNWEYSVGGWADYDLDGDLDCIVGQVNNPNVYLFRNDGDHFIDAATEAGLDGSTLGGSSRLTWLDFDLDGDPDIYSSYNFFRNDNGVFTEVTEEMGLGELADVSYREMFDYDNDGDFDFFKTVSASNSASSSEMWENQDGVFVDVTVDVGLIIDKDRYRSMTIGDFDNDGDEDVFVQLNIPESLDVLLVNDLLGPGERAFTDVAEFIGITIIGDRKGSAFLDYDMDGWLDVYLPSVTHNHIMYHNLGGNGANWVAFMLEGTASNRDAVGTLVKLYTAEKMQVRYTKAGNGWVRQDNPHVHFGIGFESAIDSAVIHWPLGLKQVLTDVAVNQYHKVKEPAEIAVGEYEDGTVPEGFRLAQNYPNPFNPATTIAYKIADAGKIDLIIYDLKGREVRHLVDERQNGGSYSVTWNGLDDSNNLLPSGVYIYQLKAGSHVESRKMVFVK